MYLRSLKRRTETFADVEVKGDAGHKCGPSRLRSDVIGLAAQPDFGVYPYSGAPEFGFSTLWLVNTPEMVGTTCVFYIPSMLSAIVGARGCDSMCR
jgi:hypothetical protein